LASEFFPVALGELDAVVLRRFLDVGEREVAVLSDTPRTWSKRAIALRTCDSSVSGSLRFFGNA
jgi:hypothetical protein